MAQFKFKLETVLKVKGRIEDLRKRQLQVAEVEREKAEKQLMQRQDEVVDTLNTYRNTCRQKLDLYVANNYHKFLIWQNKQVEMADQYLGVCTHNVVDKRQELIAASREKKTVEKLKEKAFETYKAEELNVEIKFLDELGTGQFIRHNENIKEETQK